MHDLDARSRDGGGRERCHPRLVGPDVVISAMPARVNVMVSWSASVAEALALLPVAFAASWLARTMIRSSTAPGGSPCAAGGGQLAGAARSSRRQRPGGRPQASAGRRGRPDARPHGHRRDLRDRDARLAGPARRVAGRRHLQRRLHRLRRSRSAASTSRTTSSPGPGRCSRIATQPATRSSCGSPASTSRARSI